MDQHGLRQTELQSPSRGTCVRIAYTYAGVRRRSTWLLRDCAPLGAGGMGEVYRARDSRLGREVAVKVLPDSLVQRPEVLNRFHQEARILASLSHPNIVVLHDVGAESSVAVGPPLMYAVMELLEGETLRQRLARAPLTWKQAVDIAAETRVNSNQPLAASLHRETQAKRGPTRCRCGYPLVTAVGKTGIEIPRLERIRAAADMPCTVRSLRPQHIGNGSGKRILRQQSGSLECVQGLAGCICITRQRCQLRPSTVLSLLRRQDRGGLADQWRIHPRPRHAK
jgi:hypothetical protein